MRNIKISLLVITTLACLSLASSALAFGQLSSAAGLSKAASSGGTPTTSSTLEDSALVLSILFSMPTL